MTNLIHLGRKTQALWDYSVIITFFLNFHAFLLGIFQKIISIPPYLRSNLYIFPKIKQKIGVPSSIWIIRFIAQWRLIG